jgi:hypothetical protein
MKRYQSKTDAVVGAVLFAGQLACIIILLAHTCWWFWSVLHAGLNPLWCAKVILHIALSPIAWMFVAVLFLRRDIVLGRYNRWVYLVAQITALLAMLSSFN